MIFLIYIIVKVYRQTTKLLCGRIHSKKQLNYPRLEQQALLINHLIRSRIKFTENIAPTNFIHGYNVKKRTT